MSNRLALLLFLSVQCHLVSSWDICAKYENTAENGLSEPRLITCEGDDQVCCADQQTCCKTTDSAIKWAFVVVVILGVTVCLCKQLQCCNKQHTQRNISSNPRVIIPTDRRPQEAAPMVIENQPVTPPPNYEVAIAMPPIPSAPPRQ